MRQEISLDGGFDTVVRQSGSTVELHSGGDVTVKVAGARLEVHADGSVDAFTEGAVKVHPAANDAAPARAVLKPGDRVADGTIFAGTSPDTGKAMYATAADAALTYIFNDAQKFAQGLNKQKAHGHEDWHVPTKNELNVLFNNRAAIGGFDKSGLDPAGWYWSSEQHDYDTAWQQRFSDGKHEYRFKYGDSSLRCVR